MNLNSSLDKFLKATVWLWLPFYAFFALLKEWRGRMDK
jgi:hypothetical protein